MGTDSCGLSGSVDFFAAPRCCSLNLGIHCWKISAEAVPGLFCKPVASVNIDAREDHWLGPLLYSTFQLDAVVLGPIR